MSKADVGDFHTKFLSPMRCFSSRLMARPKKRNHNAPKINLFTFLESPRVPGGSMGHLPYENEASGPRNRAIGVPTPDFGKKTSKKIKIQKI